MSSFAATEAIAEFGTLPGRVHEHASRRADAVALIDADSTISYGDLDRRIDRAVAALQNIRQASQQTAVGTRQLEEAAGNLSYGHQRLLEVAMGLGLAPRLLILDEPTQGLSDEEITAFIALVCEIAQESTVLLIEHNMHVVMGLADRITVLDRGRVLAEGAPEEIRANDAVQRAYLGG